MSEPHPQLVPRPALGLGLHVLHVVDRNVFNRFGRMLRHVTLALDEEDVQNLVLTDDPAAAAGLEGTPIQRCCVERLRGWWSWRLGAQLRQWLDPLPQIVHLWGAATLPSVGRWAVSQGLAVVAHALSAWDVEYLAQLRPRPDLILAAGCAGLVRFSQEIAPAAAARFDLLPPAFLMPEPHDEDAPRERTLGVLWTGRIDLAAGLETLIDAVAQIQQQAGDLQVVLIGDGPGLDAVWERIRRAKVQGCVTFVNEPAAWDQAMHGVDACVVLARQEELALAPLLAMALGKIVIASRDQIAEWFIEDVTCWQFQPGSAVELAYHLTRAASRDRHARELRKSAAAYVRQQHALAPLASRLVATYLAAMESNAGWQRREERDGERNA